MTQEFKQNSYYTNLHEANDNIPNELSSKKEIKKINYLPLVILILFLLILMLLVLLVIIKTIHPSSTNMQLNSNDTNNESGKVSIGGRYYKDRNGIYRGHCQGFFCFGDNYFDQLANVDSGSFQVLEGDYAKDNRQVYYFDKPIPDADSKSFVVLYEIIAKDKNHVYQMSQIYPDADAKSFVMLSESFFKDKNHIFIKDIFLKILLDVNPSEFQSFGDFYGSFRSTGYYRDKKMPVEIDISSFVTFPDSYYAKDKNYVYDHGDVIPADPNTFQVLKGAINTTDDYAKDKDHVFYFGQIMKNADPNTYQILKDNYYSRDKNHIYHYDLIVNADPDSFEVVNGTLGKDKYYYYNQGLQENRIK